MLIFFTWFLPIQTISAQDFDGDSIEDSVDLDDDNDGILDFYEQREYIIPEKDYLRRGDTYPIIYFNGATSGRFRVELNSYTNCYRRITTLNAIVDLDVQQIQVISYSHYNGNQEIIGDNTTNVYSVSRSYGQIGYDLEQQPDGSFQLIFNHIFNPCGNPGVAKSTQSYWSTIPTGSSSLDFELDSDKDGILDQFDLDSDNDGCPDALEGNSSYNYTNLALNKSLGNAVDTDSASASYGVPNIAGSGNSVRTSRNPERLAGVCVTCDNASSLFVDTDGDSVGDDCDLDDDNDGVLDAIEQICDQNINRTLSNVEWLAEVWDGKAEDVDGHAEPIGERIAYGTYNEFPESLQINLSSNNADGWVRGTAQNFLTVYGGVTDYTGGDSGTKFYVKFSRTITAAETGTYLYTLTGADAATVFRTRDGFRELIEGEYHVWRQTKYISIHLEEGDLIEVATAEIGGTDHSLGFAPTADLTKHAVQCFLVDYDSDGDGIVNSKDLDSDNDGCSDTVESTSAVVSSNNVNDFNNGLDANENGLLDEYEDNATGQLNYTETYYYAINKDISACLDTDNDDIGDLVDVDDDNDGIPDVEETDCVNNEYIEGSSLSWHGEGASSLSVTADNTLVVGGSAWANIYSDRVFSLPISIEGELSSVSNGMIGILPESEVETTSWNDGGYRFQMSSGNGIYIRNSPDNFGWVTPKPNDVSFKIIISSQGVMNYYYDGDLIYKGSVPVTDYKIVLSRGAFTINNFKVTEREITCADLFSDSDTIPNRLDLDSDNDGCSDAFESGSDTTNNTTTYPSGADTNKNGLLDKYENASTGEINYASNYYYAKYSHLNNCNDFDNDTVLDYLDIDDDNDGVLDMLESPSCFYSANEAAEIVSIRTEVMRYSSYYLSNAIDGDSNTIAAFTADKASVGDVLFEVTTKMPIPLDTLSYEPYRWAVTNGTDRIKLQGYNANYWEDLTPELESTIVNDTVFIKNTLKPEMVFSKFRAIVSSGSNYYAGIREIHLKPHSSYLATAYRKEDCDEDFDVDSKYNYQDLDSDADGCSDSVESSNTTSDLNNITDFNSGADTNKNGLLDEFEDGTSGLLNYKDTYAYAINDEKNACLDTDGDSIGDLVDIDDDNDGILDDDESNCQDRGFKPVVDLTWHGSARTNIVVEDDVFSVTGSIWANAYSDQTFKLPIVLEGEITTAVNGMIGFLAIDKTETTNWNDKGYKFQFNASYGMYIRHGSLVSGWYSPTVVGKSFKLTIDDEGNMLYFNDGTLVYSGVVPVQDYKLVITRGAFKVKDFKISELLDDCSRIDTDGDLIPNHLDLDSDADGCNDGVEAGGLTLADNSNTYIQGVDSNENGLLDRFELDQTGEINYESKYYLALDDTINNCIDTDGDNIVDTVDIDDDNDGILDTMESDCNTVKEVFLDEINWHGTAKSNVSELSNTTLSVSGNAWANAYSDESFELPITMEGTVKSVVHGMIGFLPAENAETSSWKDLGYKFQMTNGYGMYIRHGSINSGWYSPAMVNRLFSLHIDENGKMTYSLDGTVIYTNTVPVTTYKITLSRGAFLIEDFKIIEKRDTCLDIDYDEDGIPNRLDLDSDKDACSDSVESGNTDQSLNNIADYNTGVDANENGLLDEFEAAEGELNYEPTYEKFALNEEESGCEVCYEFYESYLCGNDLDLSPNVPLYGAYIWYKDSNNNNELDTADEKIKEATLEANDYTLNVTDIGTYLLYKSKPKLSEDEDLCPFAVEVINVSRYGSTQTNPIVDWFTKSNEDGNANSDVKGELITCPIDGSLLPKIFLCGSLDSKEIQLNISDTETIVWRKLLEGSCESENEKCANKQMACQWDNVGEGMAFTAVESGSYKVNLNYKNGCTSSFYFEVYKNDLEVNYTSKDIYCGNPGAIQVQNIGANYGFKLYDVVNNVDLVSYSEKKGPSFDIAEAGTYKVIFTPLDSEDNPIEGACEFSTTDVEIVEKNIEVNFSTTVGDCFGGGDIEIDVQNIRGDYNYELYQSNENGDLVTLVDSKNAHPDNAFTFPDLNAGAYQVVVKTNDGCESQTAVTVSQTPSLTLSASVSKPIDCSSGAIVVTPNGGKATSGYRIAIWSKNGVANYTDIDDISSGDLTADTNYTFKPGEEGAYVFVVLDDNNCEAFSNSVLIEDKGILTINAPNLDKGITCYGEASGAFTINVQNGTAPYTYSLDGFTTSQTSPAFVGLVAGSYTIAAIDALGCEATFDYELTEPEELKASAQINNSNVCNSDGTYGIEIVNVTGGTMPYEYSFDGSSFKTGAGAETANLSPGDYNLIVRDANKCEFAIGLQIEETQSAPDISTWLTYNCDGTAQIHVENTEETYEYVYTLNGTESASADKTIFDKVTPGSHDLEVVYTYKINININNVESEVSCGGVIQQSVYVEPDKEFQVNKISSTNVTCNGEEDGTITVEVKNFNGNEGYEYSLDNGATYIFSVVSELTTDRVFGAGVAKILFKTEGLDDDCEITITENITEPDAMGVTSEITSPYTCVNSGANISTVATGGTSPYQYQLEDENGVIVKAYQSSSVFESITEGEYLVRVMDQYACEVSIGSPLVIGGPKAPDFELVTTPCYNGDNNASIQINVTTIDGNGGYQFKLNNGQWQIPSSAIATTYMFENLAKGDYTIAVKDQYGCLAAEQAVTILPKLYANIAIEKASSCADGEVNLSAFGGDSNYVYAVVVADIDPTGKFVSTTDFLIANSEVGDYDVYVRDKNGGADFCEYKERITIELAQPLVYTASAEDAKCNGGDGLITVDVTSGEVPMEIALIEAGSTIRTEQILSVGEHTLYNVNPSTYSVTITDAYDCEVSKSSLVINDPVKLTAEIIDLFIDSSVDDCQPADGFKFVNYPTGLEGDLEFSHDGGQTWQSSDTFKAPTYDLNSGDLIEPSIRTVDVDGKTLCRLDLDEHQIEYPLDSLDITLSPIVITCNDLQVKVKGTKGDYSLGYRYTYTDNPKSFDPDNAVWTDYVAKDVYHNFKNIDPDTPQLTGLPLLIPGRTYVFYVKDSNGCIRQSNENINTLVVNPLDITCDIKPACNGQLNGEIVFNIVPETDHPNMRWELFAVGNTTPLQFSGGGTEAANIPFSDTVTVTGLGENDYYIVINQSDEFDIDNCLGASENKLLIEQEKIEAEVSVERNISCNLSGILKIEDQNGGGGEYVYSVSGPAGFTSISNSTNERIEIPANSPSGDYEVIVADQYGCESVSYTVAVTLSDNPTIDSVDVDNCTEPASVQINATSTSANILYSIDGGVTYFDNGGLFKNIESNSYNVAIKDANGCAASAVVEVYTNLEASVSLGKKLDCTASPNATINISVNNGSGSYEYEITGPVNESRKSLPTNTFVWEDASIAGDYVVKIYDTATSNPTCSKEFAVKVDDLLMPDFEFESESSLCFGASNGRIILSQIENGLDDLTYEISPNTGTFNSVQNTFENLAPGLYTITGKASNSCEKTVVDIPISEPNQLLVSQPNFVDFTCDSGNENNRAQIILDVTSGITGGSGNYNRFEFTNTTLGEIIQDGENSSLSITADQIGDYAITVYDTNGCSAQTSITVNEFDALLEPEIQVVSLYSCENLGEEVKLIASGSLTSSNDTTHNYSFKEISTGIVNTTGGFSSLTPGVHYFEVSNTVTNCSRVIAHRVSEPETYDILITKISDETCFGLKDGEITLSFINSSYTGDLSWTVYNTSGSIDDAGDDVLEQQGTFSSSSPSSSIFLGKGSYRVETKQIDFPVCIQEKFVTIKGSEAPLVTNSVEVGTVGCSNDSGVISVTPSGGVGPYEITVTMDAYNMVRSNVSAYLFSDLSAGDYEIIVKDQLGCETLVETVSLIEPLPINATVGIDALLDCEESKDGEIIVQLTQGGFGQVFYQLNTYGISNEIIETSLKQTSNTFDNLGIGAYSVTVSDEANCSFETQITNLTAPETMVGSLVRTSQLTCETQATLQLEVTGGTAPYTWSESETGTYQAFDNGSSTSITVGDGTFSYYIKDANNCKLVKSNSISEEPIVPLAQNIELSAAKINCFGDATASISSQASGGLGNYEYALFQDALLTMPVGTANQTGVFENLSAGSYYIKVVSVDCDVVSSEIVIEDALEIVVDTTFKNVSCNGEDDGEIEINLSGGTGEYQYAISPNLDKFQDEHKFENLEPDVYTVIAQDSNGCFTELVFTITEPEVMKLDFSSVAETCSGAEDGAFVVEITGGTAPYRYSLNDGALIALEGSVLNNENMASGYYNIKVYDVNDCEKIDLVEVKAGVDLTAEVVVNYECDSEIPVAYISVNLNDESILEELLFSLDGKEETLDPNFGIVAPGYHSLKMMHSSGCENTIEFNVEEFEPLSISLANNEINTITATVTGGTGNYVYYFDEDSATNDSEFYISKSGTYTVTVQDKQGCTVSASIEMEFIDIEIPIYFTPDGDGYNDTWELKNIEGYPNLFMRIYDRYGREVYIFQAGKQGWDGFYNKASLATGDYWYVLKLNGDSDNREFVGHVTLYR